MKNKMALRKPQVTMGNNVLKIHLSVPIQNTADTISTLHRFIDSVEDLCYKSDYGTIALTIKCKPRFLGSRTSETGCTSASLAANEMRTCEDPIDE